MWQFTYAMLLRYALALIGHGGSPPQGPLFGVWLGLYQQGTPPVTPQSVMSNIVEANFDGYSRQQAVWFPPYISSSGNVLLVGQDLYYTPTDALVPNKITGCFLADSFYGGLLLAGAIAPGVGFMLSNPNNAVKIQPQVALTPQQLYGAPAWVS